jgi:YVTN family beta-propeller protein
MGVAFDGTHLWVTNTGDDTVTKIRASDRTIVATTPVGDAPKGIAFDGTQVWVANSASGTVTKLP